MVLAVGYSGGLRTLIVLNDYSKLSSKVDGALSLIELLFALSRADSSMVRFSP